MKNYINKAAVVAEIKRLINSHKPLKTLDPTYCEGLDDSLDDILSFIDTLEVKEVKEEPVSKTLEEAAFDYADACKYDGGEKLLCVEHFKAGVQWQALHSLDSIKGMEEQAFLAGVEAEQNKSFLKHLVI